MLSNFSHTFESLRRMSAHSSSDVAAARAAADELSNFIVTQHKKIIDYVQLKSIVTMTSSSEIKDALTSMRHVTSALRELAENYREGLLASAFEVPFHQANEALKKAEKQVGSLLSHLVS